MRAGYLFLLLFLGVMARAQVKGIVLQRSNYCGGDELSEEDMKSMVDPTAISGKKCFVRKGKTNKVKAPVVATFITDAKGNFTLALPPGDYCIIDDRKLNRKYVNGIVAKYNKATELWSKADKTCMEEWLKAPDAVFTVQEDRPTAVEVLYVKHCPWGEVPCTDYLGSPPP